MEFKYLENYINTEVNHYAIKSVSVLFERSIDESNYVSR